MLRIALGFGFTLLALIISLPAPSSAQDVKATGSIAGRVMIGDKPASGAAVAVVSSDAPFQQAPLARTRADEQGYYRITGLRPGNFIVTVAAPPYIAPVELNSSRPGKPVTLQEGESLESVDIKLTRGGVITGRVTDADGRPLIATRIRLQKQDQRGPFNLPSSMMLETDDRGIYRLYGIPEGRYMISVGEDANQGAIRMGNPGEFYVRTYHPDVTDFARATVIEVTPGGEATGIDIKVGRPSKTYSVTGRVIDGQTGRPVTGAICGYGPLSEDGKMIQGYGSGFRTDSAGSFRMDGLVPGRYAAFANLEGESSSYSEPVLFRIEGDDVAGLEIKLISGSTVSGHAVIEGTDDPAVLSRISQLQIYASIVTEGVLRAPRREVSRPASDGSFRIAGLPPGKFTIHISSFPVQKGFLLLRVESNGVELNDPIDLVAGENITGLKLAIGYGTSIIRGQIRFEGGTAPPDTRFNLSIRRQGEGPRMPSGRPVEADERGRFQLDGLVAGEYEIHLIPYRILPEGGRVMTGNRLSKLVTVGHNTETEVTFVVDLSENRRDNE